MNLLTRLDNLFRLSKYDWKPLGAALIVLALLGLALLIGIVLAAFAALEWWFSLPSLAQ